VAFDKFGFLVQQISNLAEAQLQKAGSKKRRAVCDLQQTPKMFKDSKSS